MKKTIVIYKSRYGFTKQYAKWIAEDLDAEIRDLSQVNEAELSNYETIIFGGGLYAGGVSGLSFLKKSFPLIKDKSLYLFTVGVADVEDERNIKNIRNSLSKVLTLEMQERINLFHLRAGIDYPKLSFVHRTMMSMLVWVLRRRSPEKLREEDHLLLKTYGQVVDFSDKSTITPMVEQISARSN